MNNTELLQQMRLPVKQAIPAGWLDNSLEIFYQNVEVYAIVNGAIIAFTNWPKWIYNLIEKDLSRHPRAIQALSSIGINERTSMLWQYCRCRFGSYDGNPDLSATGEIIHTEYWDCGIRGCCPHEGKLCSSMKAKHGVLTPREIEIISLVAEDFSNKEIANKLFIAETTVPVHLQNIYQKIGSVKRRGRIIRFALKHNIVHLNQSLYDHRSSNAVRNAHSFGNHLSGQSCNRS